MESEKKVVKVNMEVEKEVIWKAKRKKKRMKMYVRANKLL